MSPPMSPARSGPQKPRLPWARKVRPTSARWNLTHKPGLRCLAPRREPPLVRLSMRACPTSRSQKRHRHTTQIGATRECHDLSRLVWEESDLSDEDRVRLAFALYRDMPSYTVASRPWESRHRLGSAGRKYPYASGGRRRAACRPGRLLPVVRCSLRSRSRR